MRHRMRRYLPQGVFVLGLMLSGCSSPVTRFTHPEADFSFYESVGIIPFETLGQDRLAGEKVTNVFFAELLTKNFAVVCEPGQFEASIQRVRGTGISNLPWSAADVAQLAKEANVQGVFTGTVRDYEMTSVGRSMYPLVSVEVRLLDASTGNLVWSASVTRRGGPAFPFLFWRETHTLGELTTEVCRRILETLPTR